MPIMPIVMVCSYQKNQDTKMTRKYIVLYEHQTMSLCVALPRTAAAWVEVNEELSPRERLAEDVLLFLRV